VRQSDGGRAIPLRTRGANFRRLGGPAIRPDPAKPFSHLVTGVVLRAFAAHPRRRQSSAARHRAGLLAARHFEADVYPDRSDPEYWTAFSFSFWFTDLMSALDSLSRIGWPANDANLDRAAQHDAGLKTYLVSKLDSLAKHPKSSISKRATMTLSRFR
jgi:hypothetical protein